MGSIVTNTPAPRHPVLPDIGRAAMAKAAVRNPDMDWLVALGRALQYAVAVAGWTHKEAAAHIGTDDAEFGKWVNGTRRTQVDKVIAVEALRWPFIVGLGKHSGAAEVETTLRRVG